MFQYLSVLLILICPCLSVAETPSPLPFEEVMSTEQQDAIIPAEIRKPLLAAFAFIPWQESDLAKTPSLLFTSGQSLSGEEKRVLNRVHFFSGERFDIWVMKQATSGRGFNFKTWNRFVIAVDKKSRPNQSYYFQFGRESDDEKNIPDLKIYSVACLSCHSSGPRLIRPELTEWTKAFSPFQSKRLNEWNEKIKNYREVVDYSPKWLGHSILEWEQPGARDELKIQTCVECHSTDSKIRSFLRRQNAESIWYLTRHLTNEKGFVEPMNDSLKTSKASMPMDHPPLNKSELKCLKSWLDQNPKAMSENNCTASGDLKRPSQSEWILDPFQTNLRALAKTKIGDITVSHFLANGSANCSKSSSKNEEILCSGEIQMNLQNLRTGIQLRDTHLAKLLAVDAFPTATAKFIALPVREGTAKSLIQLSLGNHVKAIPATTTCKLTYLGYRCDFNAKLSLQKFSLVAPSFMGLEVSDAIEISGTIAFREKL